MQALRQSLRRFRVRELSEKPNADPVVGIQVGAVSFVDEGVEKCLDDFQQDGGVNTLFIATFTYGRGIAGRQVPGQPLPDHGKQQYDTDTFHGGCYTKSGSEVFRQTAFKISARPTLATMTCLNRSCLQRGSADSKPFAGLKMSSARTCPISIS